MKSTLSVCEDSAVRQQQQANEEEVRHTLEESRLMLLAERYFLSPAVVRDAWNVFRRYSALEERRRWQSARLMGEVHSPLESQTTIGTSSVHAEPENGIGGSKKAQDRVCIEAEKGPNRKGECMADNDLLTSAQPESTEGRNLSGFAERLQEEGKMDANEEPVLGLIGLHQLFHDMGVLMPALAVSDLVHGMNDDPVDFVLHQRSVAEASSVATLAASLPRSGTSRRSRSPDHNAVSKLRENRSRGSGRKKTISTTLPEGSHEESLGALGHQNKLSRDTVTFPLFLFILSQVPLESGDIVAVRNREVGDLFHTLDLDGDGIISVGDVQAVVQRLMHDGVVANDREIEHLCAMSSTELETALLECDVDGDGHVTLEDLLSVLRS